jgi:hypothetical protein
MKNVDYSDLIGTLKHHGGRNDGFLTDQPRGITLSDDDYIRCRYDAQSMQWRYSRPSRIKYPTARELIKQYRYRRVCHRR